jgi:valyl-tRNA synthetase
MTSTWQETEQKIWAKWEQHNCFSSNHNPDGEPYSIIMPPANVTGSLHLGHALTFTIQDTLIRYNRLQGKRVLWQPGTDHAGIATQIIVEKQLKQQGLSRTDLGREKFIEKVWQWKEQSGGQIINQLKRLGASADWSRERFTMDPESNKAVTKVFIDLYEQGFIYRDERLVNWDSSMQSAISDLEVTNKETKGQFYYIKYPLVSNPQEHILIATTRPETLFGDQAIAIHPENEALKHLIGQEVHLPLTDRTIPIIADEYSDPEKGTGAVKITPAHDFNDFEVGKRHALETHNILHKNGTLNENVPESFIGLTIEQARAEVIKALEESDLLDRIEEKEQSLPISDRTGCVIEPLLTQQWFVDAGKLAKKALEAVEDKTTSFIPENWTETYYQWMRNIHPWCISRQIWWGHSIPVWYGPNEEIIVTDSQEAAQQLAVQRYGKNLPLTQDSDVLDTWFSSALWPFVTLGWPNKTPELATFYPTSVLVTGCDILFFWVARMMMMGCQFMDAIPFKDVYIHALIRDKKGQKMSKSKGNVVDPLDVMDKFGTDALRFTLTSMATPGRDIKFSEEKVEASRNFVTKLRNAARYVEMTGAQFTQTFNAQDIQHPINQWFLSELATFIQDVTNALNNYELNVASHRLYHFIWGTYCDWYLELTKPLLKQETFKKETQDTLAWGLHQILHALHPIMPFITEEIWQQFLPNAQPLMLSHWPKVESIQQHTPEIVPWLIDLIKTVRAIKAEIGIKPSQHVDLIAPNTPLTNISDTTSYLNILEHIGRIRLSSEATNLNATMPVIVGTETYHMRVDGLVDFAAEIARLERTLQKRQKEQSSLEARLQNPNFVSKAAPEVITEAQESLATLISANEKTSQAIAALQKISQGQ